MNTIAVIETYMKGLDSGPPSARQAPLNLDTFVWECLKTSANTPAPSELLRQSRKFHRDVVEIHGKIADGVFASGHGKQQLEAIIAGMRDKAPPEFDRNLDSLRKELKARGVEMR